MRLFLGLFLYVSSLFAIIDIASVDFGDKQNGFSGSAYGSFQKSRGNTNKDENEYGGRIQYDTNKTITWLQAALEDDKANDQSNAQNTFLHLRHIRQIYHPTWALELYGQLKQDKFKSVQNRTVTGTGARYKIVDSKPYGKLFAGLSVMDERIRYTDYTVDPYEHNYRASTYLSYKVKLNDILEFSYLGYYQPKLDHGSDYMTASTAELSIHLSKVFDLSYLFEFDYDAKPAHDVLRTDTHQKLSFIYRFGKSDPLSGYADGLIHSIDGTGDTAKPQKHALEHNTSSASSSADVTPEGRWTCGEEVLLFLDKGKGRHLTLEGVYTENFYWTFVSADTSVRTNTGAKFISIVFEDEEGREGRVENYLWDERTLVGLGREGVRLFKR